MEQFVFSLFRNSDSILHDFMQNFLKDLMALIAAYMYLKIPQTGSKMFMYDFFFHNLFTYIDPPACFFAVGVYQHNIRCCRILTF